MRYSYRIVKGDAYRDPAAFTRRYNAVHVPHR